MSMRHEDALEERPTRHHVTNTSVGPAKIDHPHRMEDVALLRTREEKEKTTIIVHCVALLDREAGTDLVCGAPAERPKRW